MCAGSVSGCVPGLSVSALHYTVVNEQADSGLLLAIIDDASDMNKQSGPWVPSHKLLVDCG